MRVCCPDGHSAFLLRFLCVMAKRFIDTGLFDDDWFMDLSKEAKLLWIYFITKCDHAGILKLNEKLCRVQTDIRDLNAVIIQLGNRLVAIGTHHYFIPKFIEYQYPGFPNSKVRQQASVVNILLNYNLLDIDTLKIIKDLPNTYLTVTEPQNKKMIPYEHEHDNEHGNEHENEQQKSDFEIFWNLYNKKVGDKTKLLSKWLRLKQEDRDKIFETLPVFLSNVKDKQYQPYPETYLNNKRWNDEIVQQQPTSPHQPAPR